MKNATWIYLLMWVARRIRWNELSSRAGRYTRKYVDTSSIIELTYAKVGPDLLLYSREELIIMLQTVRRNEKRQNWKVPDNG